MNRFFSHSTASITLLGLAALSPCAFAQLIYEPGTPDPPLSGTNAVVAPDGFVIRNGLLVGFFGGGSITAGAGTNSFIGQSNPDFTENSVSALQLIDGSATAHNLYLGNGSTQSGRISLAGINNPDASLTVNNDFYVGFSNDAEISLQLKSHTETKNTYIGFGSGTLASADLNSGATWNNSGVFNLGTAGTAVLTVGGGSTLTTNRSSGRHNFGQNDFGTAVVLVSGEDTTWNTRGFFLKNGQISIDSGAVLNTTTDVTLGDFDGTGLIEVSGAGSIWNSSSSTEIGHFGTGVVSISDGATWNSFDTSIGRNDNTGSVGVTGTSTTWNSSGTIRVGDYGPGSLGISDGATVNSDAVSVGILRPGTAVVSGVGTSLNTSVLSVRSSAGLLIVSDGASLTTTTEAKLDGDNSTALVTDAGSTWVTPVLDVGRNGTGTLTVSRDGKVSANSLTLGLTNGSGTLNIGAAASVSAVPAGIIDTATISGADGTGTVQFNTTGTTYFTRDGTASGTGVNTAGNLALVVTAGTNVLTGNLAHTGGTNINGGILEVRAGSAGGAIPGNIANQATLRFNGDGASSVGGTISGTGAIRLVGTGTVTFSGANNYTGGLFLDPGSTVRLANNAAAGNSFINVNNATVDYADGISNFNTIQPVGTLKLNVASGTATQGVISGSATTVMEKTGAGTLVLTNTNTMNGGVTLSGGVLSFSTNNALPGQPADGVLTFDGGTLRYTRALTNYFHYRPTVITSNHGTLDVTEAGSSFTMIGALSGSGTFNKTGAGALRLFAANTFSGQMVVDEGTLRMGSSGSIPDATGIHIASGATFDVSALAGGFTLDASQALSGHGTIQGNVTTAGTIAPGSSTGELKFTGDLEFAPTSLIQMELASLSDFDRIVVEGMLTYGGTLALSFLDGYLPSVGDTFDLVDGFSSHSGAFEAIQFPTSSYAANFDYATGQLTFTAIPEPSAIAFLGLATLGAVARRRRRETEGNRSGVI